MRFDVLASMDVYEAGLRCRWVTSLQGGALEQLHLSDVRTAARGWVAECGRACRQAAIVRRAPRPQYDERRAIAAKPITTLSEFRGGWAFAGSVSYGPDDSGWARAAGRLLQLRQSRNRAGREPHQGSRDAQGAGSNAHASDGTALVRNAAAHLRASLVALIVVEALAAILRSSLSIDLAPVMLRRGASGFSCCRRGRRQHPCGAVSGVAAVALAPGADAARRPQEIRQSTLRRLARRRCSSQSQAC